MLTPQELKENLEKQRHEAEEKDAERRATQLGYTYMNLISTKVPTEIKAMVLVPEEEAKNGLLVPLQLVKKNLVVAAFNPVKKETEETINRLKQDFDVKIIIASMASLHHAWSYYQYIEEVKEISGKVDIDQESIKKTEETTKSLNDLTKKIETFESPYVSQVLEIILAGALALRASDIHLEPGNNTNTLRLRIDGVLHIVYSEFKTMIFKSLATRIKLLSNLKLNVKDEPQDGRFTIGIKDRDIEIRTSIIPSEYGETVVLRILDPTALKANLEELGWRGDDLEIAKKEIGKPNGLILNTGPTGSGKTTTLYAFLRHLSNPEIKIITIEDPIEYHLPGISQTQVNEDAKYTFASGLRSILRQDPDIILVGEIRDKETAEIAINASLTGHLVFSTLHTNDAIGAVPRFVDLGAKPQTLGPALSLVIAQRLVRKLCPICKKEASSQPAPEKIKVFLEKLPPRVNKSEYQNKKTYEATGCNECGGIGYRGRISIFELFVINEEMEKLVYENPTEIKLKAEAKKQGMVTMQEDGILKALQGITSLEEVETLTGPLEW